MSDDAREAWELVELWRARREHGRYGDVWAVLPKHLLALAAEVEQLRLGLESLRMEEKVTVYRFESTRTISAHVLNEKIDAILKGNAE